MLMKEKYFIYNNNTCISNGLDYFQYAKSFIYELKKSVFYKDSDLKILKITLWN